MSRRLMAGTAQSARRGLTALVGAVMVLAAIVALPTAAAAHAGHSCTGVEGSGFSCTRGGKFGDATQQRVVHTYYSGSRRTSVVLNFVVTLSGHGFALAEIVLCDRRNGDNVSPVLEVIDNAGGRNRYWMSGDTERCLTIETSGDVRAHSIDNFRVLTRQPGTTRTNHATVWCSSCVPPRPS